MDSRTQVNYASKKLTVVGTPTSSDSASLVENQRRLAAYFLSDLELCKLKWKIKTYSSVIFSRMATVTQAQILAV